MNPFKTLFSGGVSTSQRSNSKTAVDDECSFSGSDDDSYSDSEGTYSSSSYQSSVHTDHTENTPVVNNEAISAQSYLEKNKHHIEPIRDKDTGRGSKNIENEVEVSFREGLDFVRPYAKRDHNLDGDDSSLDDASRGEVVALVQPTVDVDYSNCTSNKPSKIHYERSKLHTQGSENDFFFLNDDDTDETEHSQNIYTQSHASTNTKTSDLTFRDIAFDKTMQMSSNTLKNENPDLVTSGEASLDAEDEPPPRKSTYDGANKSCVTGFSTTASVLSKVEMIRTSTPSPFVKELGLDDTLQFYLSPKQPVQEYSFNQQNSQQNKTEVREEKLSAIIEDANSGSASKSHGTEHAGHQLDMSMASTETEEYGRNACTGSADAAEDKVMVAAGISPSSIQSQLNNSQIVESIVDISTTSTEIEEYSSGIHRSGICDTNEKHVRSGSEHFPVDHGCTESQKDDRSNGSHQSIPSAETKDEHISDHGDFESDVDSPGIETDARKGKEVANGNARETPSAELQKKVYVQDREVLDDIKKSSLPIGLHWLDESASDETVAALQDTLSRTVAKLKESEEAFDRLQESSTVSELQKRDDEIFELRSALKRTKDDFDELKASSDEKISSLESSHSEEVHELKESIATVTIASEESRLALKHRNDEFVELQKTLNTTFAKLKSSEESLTTLKATNQEQVSSLMLSHEKEVSEQKARVTQLEAISANSLSDLTKSKEQIVELQDIVNKRNDDVAGFQDTLSKTIDTLKSSEEAIGHLKADHHSKISRMEASHEEEISRLKVRLDTSTVSKECSLSDLTKAKQDMDELQEKLQSTQQDLIICEQARDKLKSSSDELISQLQTSHKDEVDELLTLITSRDRTISELEKSLETANFDLSVNEGLKRRVANLRAELEKMTASKNEKCAEISTLQSSLSGAQAELETSNEALSEIQSKNDFLLAKLDSTERNLEAEEQSAKEKDVVNGELRNSLEQAQEKAKLVKELNASLEKSEVEVKLLRKTIVSLETSVRDCKRYNEEKDRDMTNLKVELKNAEDSNLRLQQSLEEANDQRILTLCQSVEDAKAEISRVNGILYSVKEEKTKLKRNLEDAREELTSSKKTSDARILALQTSLEEATGNFEELSIRMERTKDELRSKEGEEISLTTSLQFSRDRIALLEGQKKKISEERRVAERKLIEQNAILEASLEQAKMEATSKHEAVLALEATSHETESTVSQLHKEISEKTLIIGDLKKSLKRSEDSSARLRESLLAENDERIVSLCQSLDKARIDLRSKEGEGATLKTSLQFSRDRIELLERQISEMGKDRSALEDKSTMLEASLAKSEVDTKSKNDNILDLENNLREKELKIDQLSVKLEEKETKINDLKGELNNSTQSSIRLRGSLEEVNGKAVSFSEALERRREDLEQSNKLLAHVEVEKKSLEEKLALAVEELSTSRKDRDEAVSNLENSLDEAKTALTKVERDLSSKTEELRFAQDEKATIEKSLEDAMGQIKSMRCTILAIEKECFVLKQEKGGTTEQTRVLKGEKVDLEKSLECAQLQLKLTEQRISEVEEECEALRNTLDETKAELRISEQTKSSLEISLEEGKSKARNQIEVLQDRIHDMEEERNFLVKNKNEAMDKLKHSEVERMSLKVSHEKARTQVKELEAKISQLEQDCYSIRKENDGTVANLNLLERENESLQESLRHAEDNFASTERRICLIEEERSALDRERDVSKEELRVSEEKVASLDMSLQEARNRVHLMERKISKLEEDCAVLAIEKDGAMNQTKISEEERASLDDSLKDALTELKTTKRRMSKMEKDFGALERENEEMKNGLQSLHGEKMTVTNSLQDAHGKINSLESRVSAMEDERIVLESERDGTIVELRVIEEEMSRLDESFKEANDQIKLMECKISQMENERFVLVADLDDTKEKLEICLEEKISIEKSLEEHKRELKSMESRTTRAEADRSVLESEVFTLGGEKATLEQSLLKAEAQVKSMTSNISKLEDGLLAVRGDLDGTKDELRLSEESKSSLQKSLQEARTSILSMQSDISKIEKARDVTVKSLQSQVSEYCEDVENRNNRIDALKKDLMAVREITSRLRSTQEEKEEKITSLKGDLDRTNQTLSETLESKTATELDLQRTKEELQSSKEMSESKMLALQASLDDAKVRLMTMEDDLSNAGRDVKQKEEELTRGRQYLVEIETDLKNTKTTLRSTEEKNTDLEQALQQTREELGASKRVSDEHVSALQASLDDLIVFEANLQKVRDEVKVKEDNEKKLKQCLTECQAKLAETKDLLDFSQQEKGSLQYELNQVNEKLTASSQEAESHARNLQSALDQSRESIAKLSSEFEKSSLDLRSSQEIIRSMKTKLSELEEERCDVENTVASTEEEKTILEKMVEVAAREAKQKEETILTQRAALEEKGNEFSLLQSKLSEREEQMEEKDQCIKNLESELAKGVGMEKKVADLYKELNEIKVDLAKMTETLNSTRKQKNSLHRELKECEEKLDAAEKKCESEATSSRSFLEKAKSQVLTLEGHLEKSKEALSEKVMEEEGLKKSLQESRDQVESLRKKISETEAERNEIKDKLASAQDQIDSGANFSNLEEKSKDYENSMMLLRAEVEDYKRKSKAAECKCATVQKLLDASNTKFNDSNSKDAYTKRLEDELRDLADKVSNLEKENDSLCRGGPGMSGSIGKGSDDNPSEPLNLERIVQQRNGEKAACAADGADKGGELLVKGTKMQEGEIANLKNNISNLKNDLKSVETERKILEEERDSLESSLEMFEISLRYTESRLETSTNNNTTMQENLERLTEEARLAESKMNALNEELQSIRREREILADTIITVEAERSALETSLQQCHDALRAMEVNFQQRMKNSQMNAYDTNSISSNNSNHGRRLNVIEDSTKRPFCDATNGAHPLHQVSQKSHLQRSRHAGGRQAIASNGGSGGMDSSSVSTSSTGGVSNVRSRWEAIKKDREDFNGYLHGKTR